MREFYFQREAETTKRWGISHLWKESTSEFQRSKSQLVYLPGERVRVKGWYPTPGEQGRPLGFVCLLFGFAFLTEMYLVEKVL